MARRGDTQPAAANPLGALAEQIAAARRFANGQVPLEAVGELTGEQFNYLRARALERAGMPLPAGTNRFDATVPRMHNNRRNTHETGFSIKSVADILTMNGYDPAEEMVKILVGEPDPTPDDPNKRKYKVDSKTRLQFSNELLKYVHPQRKAVDVEQRV